MVELFEKKSMVWGGFKKNLSNKKKIKIFTGKSLKHGDFVLCSYFFKSFS